MTAIGSVGARSGSGGCLGSKSWNAQAGRYGDTAQMLHAYLIVGHKYVVDGAPGGKQKCNTELPYLDARRTSDRTNHVARAKKGVAPWTFVAAPDEYNLRTIIRIDARCIDKSSLSMIYRVAPQWTPFIK